MKRKLLLFEILSFVFISMNAQSFIVEDLQYYFRSKETKEVGAYKYVGQGGNCVVPEKVSYNDTIWQVTEIYNRTFASVEGLQMITIPEGIVRIGEKAFYNCKNLTSLHIPSTIRTMGNAAFAENENLKSVIISEGVTAIGEEAFIGCENLLSVTLPNTLVRIEFAAFSGCRNLETVVIPDHVEYIAAGAFNGMDNLSGFVVGEENPSYTSINGVLYDKTGTVILAYPGKKGNTWTVPDGVLTIGTDAFSGSYEIRNITLPSSVTTIQANAFNSCLNLENITIGSGVTLIYGSTFWGCNNVQNITSLAMTPPKFWDDPGFYSFNYDATLHVPFGTKKYYEEAPYWKNFMNIVEDVVALEEIFEDDDEIHYEGENLIVKNIENYSYIILYGIDGTQKAVFSPRATNGLYNLSFLPKDIYLINAVKTNGKTIVMKIFR